MKRTAAARCLVLLVIFGVVLSLPGGLLAAVGAQTPGCPHCRGAAPGLAAPCGCCLPGTPGHCNSSGQGGGVTCRCAPGGPAFFAPASMSAPTGPASPYVPAGITAAPKLFPLNIFHPPEFHYFSA